MESSVERNCRSAGGDDSQVCGHPAGVVSCENGDARVAWNPRREPTGDTLCHTGEFGEGDAFDCLLPLNLEGNVVGELPGRFLKSLIEGGHGSEKSYRKSRWLGWHLDCARDRVCPGLLTWVYDEQFRSRCRAALVPSKARRASAVRG